MNTETVRRPTRRNVSAAAVSLFSGLLLVLTLLSFLANSASAAKTFTWERYDVTLDLREDGGYHIAERQQMRFEGGSFSGGFATLPLDRVDAITNIVAGEEIDGSIQPYAFVPWGDFDEAANTYSYRDTGNEIEIGWGFPATEDASRVFVIEYDVAGALRAYGTGADARQQIWWTAISNDVTGVAPVQEATVTIRLPRAIDQSTALLGVDAEERASEHTADGQTWTWTKQDLRAGDEFIVRLEFPSLVDAQIPTWQQADDKARLEKEKGDDRQSVYDVIFLGIGLLFTVAGAVGIYGLWYTRGRDPHVGAVADFLSEPPDDLPPGAAGALIDEVAHERDIVATLVDLGRRGVIKIDEQAKQGETPVVGGRDFDLTLVRKDPPVTGFEGTLLRSLFGAIDADGATNKLSRAKEGFSAHTGEIKEQLYDELVKRGYFPASPEGIRRTWRTGAIAFLAALVFLSCFAGGVIVSVSAYVYFPVVVLGIIATALVFMSGAMPRKTAAGAEAAAKWNAFKRYLADIEKRDGVAQSQEIFDKFLPYAVAFGLEESWVRRFSAAGAAPPAWYGPVIISGPRDWSDGGRRAGHHPGGWLSPSSGPGRTSGGGGIDIPDLQDMSEGAGRTLQHTSSGLFDMLSSAARAFGDISSSGSGGGGRRHWGGGGGGFRGGGRSGGSSGGGRRGFH